MEPTRCVEPTHCTDPTRCTQPTCCTGIHSLVETVNQLPSFMDQFVHYIHKKVGTYHVFNKFTQYV